MLNRFNSTDAAEQLLRRADHLKIDLYRDADGGVQANFELSGQVGSPDEDYLGGVGVAEPSDLRFLAALMKRFERKE